MRRVFKYQLPPLGEPVGMPEGAEVLSVAAQHGALVLWALVSPEAPLVPRSFVICGTSHAVDPDRLGRFVGTILVADGALVWHVWEARS